MWNKIFINSQNIVGETDRAFLIQMPNRSQYKGWVFWHPKKLVRLQGGKGYHITFSFTEDFEFRVILYGQGRFNSKTIIRQEYLTPNEMREAFGVVDREVNRAVEQETLKIIDRETVEVEISHHDPEKIEPVSDNTIKDLKKMNTTYTFSAKKYISENKYNASKLANFKENYAEIESKINEVAKSFEEKGQNIRKITIVLLDKDDIVIEVAYTENGINCSTESVIQLAPMPNKCVFFKTMMSFSDFIEDFSEFLGIKVRVHPVHPSFAYADKNDFAKCDVTKEELEEWEVKKTSESYLKKHIK